MALPGNHTLNAVDITAYSPSVGGTPVAAYFRVPFRCRILKVTSVLGGAITSADASCACSVNGAAAFATHVIPNAASAAGTITTTTPASPTYANEDDYVSITPSLASGASIPAMFSLVLRTA